MVESSLATSIPLKKVSSAPTVGTDENDQQWPQTDLSSQPTRRASSSTTTLWSETIRKVLRGSEDPLMDEDDSKPDPVGEEICRLLNASPAFKRPRDVTMDEEDQDETTFDPLFSSRSIRRFCLWLKSLRIPHPYIVAATMKERCVECWHFVFRDRDQPSLGRAVRLFVLLLIGLLVLLVTASYMTIMWLLRTVVLVVPWLLSLFVDFEEINRYCPSVIKWGWNLVLRVVGWIDDYVLFRKIIAGREWNEDSFVWRGMAAKSRRETLWKCPPPSASCGLLDSSQTLRQDWSVGTVQHIMAVDFCYEMLQKEHVRKKNKFTSQRRKALKRASSERIGMDKSPDKRNDFANYCKTKSDHSIPKLSPERLSPIKQGPGGRDFFGDEESQLESLNVSSSPANRLDEGSSSPEGSLRIKRSYSDSIIGSSSYLDTDTDVDGDSSSMDSREVGKHVNYASSTASMTGQDLNWLDVGTRIGIRLLNSEHVQKAIASQDTAERILDISSKIATNDERHDSIMDINLESSAHLGGMPLTECRPEAASPHDAKPRFTPQRPVHSMWTNPTSAGASVSSISDIEDSSLGSDIPSPPLRKRKSFAENGDFPPRTPPADAGRRQLAIQDGTFARDEEVKQEKQEKHRHLAKASQRKRPVERRDETEIAFKYHVSPKVDSPRVSESVETSLGRKRVEKPQVPIATMSSPTHRPARSRPALVAGMKVVVPIFPLQPISSSSVKAMKHRRIRAPSSHFQMATVVSSKRIYVHDPNSPNRRRNANCLSVTAKLDKSFLRNGEFAEMTFRVMDEWSARFMPKHSKFPIGACVATSFGLGVLVGWRVEDDCHVVRSLWQHKGPGRAHAYLNRDAIHGVVEASVGFNVDTKLGRGTVLAYVNGGRKFRSGRYFVLLKGEGRHKGKVLEFNRTDVLACDGAEFIPVIEYIREAAQYQIQLDNYEAAIRKQRIELSDKPSKEDRLWKGFETLWSSFLKAIEEDSDFDGGMSDFVSKIINFLERLDNPAAQSDVGHSSGSKTDLQSDDTMSGSDILSSERSTFETEDEVQANSFWILDGMFGGVFHLPGSKKKGAGQEDDTVSLNTSFVTGATFSTFSSFGIASAESEMSGSDSYRRAFAVIRTTMRTVSIARASSADQPNFRLALSICYEFLLFVRTVIKVQQKNVSPASVAAWKRTITEIVTTFGPVKERMEKIGRGIAERMERQGNRAKIRILRFVDIVLVDEELLAALEGGEWNRCMSRLERALVKARIVDPNSREHYHRCLMFVYSHLVPANNSDGAAARNNEKLAHLAKAVKWMASPRRSFLRLLKRDDVLEIVERIFVRVFRREREASRMLSIHASNFHSFRHLRMLKDFTIAGKLWIPLLDAAHEEFAWAVSRMPDSARDYMCPLSKLFSLCVAQFHRISAGDLTKDWLDFLMEEDAVKLIHEIDMKLILGLEAFCHDIKEVMVVLPYYSSIDDDILNLMDEVDFEEFLKEASEAIDDPDGLAAFFKEKATIAIERFLDYLPQMSIPVERRELGEGWVLTCRGENGGDLKLSDVSIRRENLVCQIIGSENVFFPMFGDEAGDSVELSSVVSSTLEPSGARKDESSVLDHIRDLLLSAQSHGCWKVGVGGVGRPPSDRYVKSALNGLPVSSVLNCGIELWRNLEIDDDELLEIAVRDVSFQIQLQKEREQGLATRPRDIQESTLQQDEDMCDLPVASLETASSSQQAKLTDPLKFPFGRFNPRRDPTVLYLEMNKLTLHLDKFMFRIEKMERQTIFDPVFDGFGSLSVRNVSIKLRVECRKERITKLGSKKTVPILHLQELDIQLAMVKFKVKDTGADWFLNKVVDGFSDNISRVVETNLKEQVSEQVKTALQNLNSYFEVNPDLMLSLLGITMGDLEEKQVWV